MTEKEKVVKLAEKLYIGALGQITELGLFDKCELKVVLVKLRETCFFAARVFYGVEE